MIYAISDIHGCYDKYQNMLEKINFSNSDTLYVLGDIIDRGKDGFKIMVDIAKRPNICTIMGNHEAMAINTLKYWLKSDCKRKSNVASLLRSDELKLWTKNGGASSLLEFITLNSYQVHLLWEYMINIPLYKEIKVEDKEYVLVHGGLENFSVSKRLSDYEIDEMVWARPQLNTRYYNNKTVVVGHTPTFMYGKCSCSDPRLLMTDAFIDIDCGCAYGGKLACYCFDTEDTVYL